MLSIVLDFLLWLQPTATAPTGAEGGAAPAPSGCGMTATTLLPMVFILGFLYFTSIRPQRKRELEHAELLKKLQKGDQVRTDGGIRGEIVKITDTEVELLIAEKTKINILRSRIAGLARSETSTEAPKEKA